MALNRPEMELNNIMIAVGIAFVVMGALIAAFAWTVIKAAIIVGLVMIILGVLSDHFPEIRKRL